MIEWNKDGITREVFLTKRYAIKIPKLLYGWEKFLHGLLSNIRERRLARAGYPELCPMVFSIPGGWMVVMRRATPLSDMDWLKFNALEFCETADYVVPAELKPDSFGWVDGRIVAIDYG